MDIEISGPDLGRTMPRLWNTSPLYSMVAASPKIFSELFTHLLHHFLRIAGARFPFDKLQVACDMLVGNYSHMRLYEEALDSAMIASDIAINQGLQGSGKNEILWGFSRAGFILRALGRHKDAAYLFYEGAKDYAEGEKAKCDQYKMAAEPFLLLGNYKEAEDAHFMYLHTAWTYRQVDLNDPHIYEMLGLFVGVYAHWTARVSTKEEHQEVNMEHLMMVLVTLLSTAGCKQHLLRHQEFLSIEKDLLKKTFRKKTMARRILDLAFQKQSVEDFRKIVLSCRNPSRNGKNMTFCIQPTKESLQSSSEDESTRAAREALRSKLNMSITICCGGPDCTATCDGKDITFMKCPCKGQFYCQKSCQVAHWKEHRKTCTYYAKMKQQKAKK